MGLRIFATNRERLRRGVENANEREISLFLEKAKAQIEKEPFTTEHDLVAPFQTSNWRAFLDITIAGRLQFQPLPFYMADKMVADPTAWFALWQFVKLGTKLTDQHLATIVHLAVKYAGNANYKDLLENASRLLASSLGRQHNLVEIMQPAVERAYWPLLAVAAQHGGFLVPTELVNQLWQDSKPADAVEWHLAAVLANNGQLARQELLEDSLLDEIALTATEDNVLTGGYCLPLQFLVNGTLPKESWLKWIDLKRADAAFFKLNLYRRLENPQARFILATTKMNETGSGDQGEIEYLIAAGLYAQARLFVQDKIQTSVGFRVHAYWSELVLPTPEGIKLLQTLEAANSNHGPAAVAAA